MLRTHGAVGGALSGVFETCYDGTEKQKKIFQRAVPGMCLFDSAFTHIKAAL